MSINGKVKVNSYIAQSPGLGIVKDTWLPDRPVQSNTVSTSLGSIQPRRNQTTMYINLTSNQTGVTQKCFEQQHLTKRTTQRHVSSYWQRKKTTEICRTLPQTQGWNSVSGNLVRTDTGGTKTGPTATYAVWLKGDVCLEMEDLKTVLENKDLETGNWNH